MGRKRGRVVTGWLVLDKPVGPGSTGVVTQCRRLFDAQKAGHAGTLDPLASGILPIAFGQATRTIPYIMDATKKYRFTLCFGESRTTDDREGDVLEASPVRPSDAQIRAVLSDFTGTIMQTPPIFSALRVGGARAYDLARQGQFPEMRARPARVDCITLLERPDQDHAVFEVQSGKGVYMRALARDIARACHSVGHISELRRTKCGPFDLTHAITLDKLSQNREKATTLNAFLLPFSTALDDIPALAVTEEEAQALRWGQTLTVPEEFSGDTEHVLRAELRGQVVGLCRVIDARIRPVKIFDLIDNGVNDVDYS